MKKNRVWLFAILFALLQCLAIPELNAQTPGNAKPIPAEFFGMSTHWFQPWPVIEFAGLRLWSTQTKWSDLNPAVGVYDWTTLDSFLNAAKQHGETDTLMTLAMTPQWASSKPNDTTCDFGPGQCDPPDDLNADGSGTDQHWKDYVAAVATHVDGQIKYWEIWNEPAMFYFWNGTFAQLTRMAKDARAVILSIEPQSKFLSPPNGAGDEWVLKWWAQYAQAGGLQYADIAAVHGGPHAEYCGDVPQASDFIAVVQNLRSVLAAFNQSKPIWDTESNWGDAVKECFKDQDLQAAFLAQWYMFHASLDIPRFYWFAYDDGTVGQLWNPATGKLDEGGVAYGYVRDWMLGATMTKSCTTSGNSIWTCNFSGPDGYLAQAIWDTAEKCSAGTCQTLTRTVNSTYTQYRTLAGETINITNHQAPIGAKPIFMENHSR
ncbi:MAG: endo-1,4-beta-xylanase [Terriglobales bacterium]|jgi:hypothetical protein